MKILILNQDWFAEPYRKQGHTVWTCGIAEHLDVSLPAPLVHIDTIIREYLQGVSPDVILIHDNSAPIVVDGLAETSIPIVFYSVDTHHHGELHEYLSHVVDYMFVAQKDYIPELERKAPCPVEWLPLWASRYIEPSERKEFGAVFVGTLNKELNPDRVAFFEELQREVDMVCKMGKFWQIFPVSEIVINQTVKGDVNFRVFEAMMSGAMLLTEWSTNGLPEIFETGRHLAMYKKGDVQDAAEKIRYYLEHKEEAAQIGKAGRNEILRAHTEEKRAEKVLEVLQSVKRTSSSRRSFAWMINFAALSNRLKKIDTDLSKKALLYALKSGESALRKGEQLDDRTAYQFVFACCQYDIWYQTSSGDTLIAEASAIFPDLQLLKLARIRNLLNQGNVPEASRVAKEVGNIPEAHIFASAEKAITELLYEGNNASSSVAASKAT